MESLLLLLSLCVNGIVLAATALFLITFFWMLFAEVSDIIETSFSNRWSLKVWEVALGDESAIRCFKLPASYSHQVLLRKIILKNIFRHAGAARAKLMLLYHQLGFEHVEKNAIRKSGLLDRVESAAVLGYTARLEDRLLLKELLEDHEDLARFTAAMSLVRLHAHEYSAQLTILITSFNPNMGRMLAEELHMLGNDVLKTALELIKKPLPSTVYINLLTLLSHYKENERAVSAILLFAQHSDEEVRIVSVRLLSRIPSQETAEFLIPLLRDRMWQIRAQAARSLGACKFPALVIAPIVEALSDENYWVRRNASDALAQLGQEGISALAQATASADRFAAEISRAKLEEIADQSNP